MSSYRFPESNEIESTTDQEPSHPYSYSYSSIQSQSHQQPIASTSNSRQNNNNNNNNPSNLNQQQQFQQIPPFNPNSSIGFDSRKSSTNSNSFSSSGGGEFDQERNFSSNNNNNNNNYNNYIDPSTSSYNSGLNISNNSSINGSGKRKGSNSSSRRMIDGREETREERRARRDAVDKNYDLTDGREDDEFTAARRHRSRAHLPANSPPLPNSSLHSPPITANSSSSSYFQSDTNRPILSNQSPPTTNTNSSSNSKSVLTIALQKAQAAVLLDSANNVSAAIAAYSQSIKLLKEVIIRAEESLERERERERVRQLTGRSNDTDEDRLRRANRFDRKEKAKLDEGRRLKVIHDTYEDRIQMLISMGGTPLETDGERNLPPSPASSSTPISVKSPTFSNQSLSPKMRRHKAEGSLSSLSGFSNNSPNTSPHPPPSMALPLPPLPLPSPTNSPQFQQQQLGEAISWNSPRSASTITQTHLTPTRETRAAEVIGSAMLLASTPPASPRNSNLPTTPPSNSNRSSRFSKELVSSDGESTPRNFVTKLVQSNSTRMRKTRSGDVSSLEESTSERLTPTLMRRTNSEQVPTAFNRPFQQPNFIPTASTASSHALSRSTYSADSSNSGSTIADSTTTNGILPSSRDTSQSFSSTESSTSKTPLIAIEPGSPLDPFFYFDSPPSEGSEKEILLEDERETGIKSPSFQEYNTPTYDSNYGVVVGIESPTSQTTTRGSKRESGESTNNRDRSNSSSSSIPRSTSGDSISSRGTSIAPSSARVTPLTPYSALPSTRSTPPSLDQPQLKEERSTSLASSSTVDAVIDNLDTNSNQYAAYDINGLSSSSGAGKDGKSNLISQSTATGTISKRRKGSLTLEVASSTGEEFALEESGYQKQTLDQSEEEEDGQREVESEREEVEESEELTNSIRAVNSNTPSSRSRSLSQPGKRPPIPSFEQSIPAVPSLPTSRSISGPRFMRKTSTPFPSNLIIPPPLLGRSHSTSSRDSLNSSSRGGNSPFPIDTPLSANFSISSTTISTNNTSNYKSSLNSSNSNYLLPPPPPQAPPQIPVSSTRRPFQLMRQILQSIEQGGYITPKLYVPQSTWSQSGVKLVAIETKVRMLDLLLNGLESVERSGEGMLMEFSEHESEMARMESGRFSKELEGLEGLVEGIQSTLEKKLGYATSGKKMGTTSFSAWSSKLSRSLDRVTSGRSLDSPATYVEGIARVFKQAQSLDQHSLYLATNEGGYSSLSIIEKQKLELRLKRISDFFGQVICRFVLKDLGMLLDKYVKRGSSFLMFD